MSEPLLSAMKCHIRSKVKSLLVTVRTALWNDFVWMKPARTPLIGIVSDLICQSYITIFLLTHAYSYKVWEIILRLNYDGQIE